MFCSHDMMIAGTTDQRFNFPNQIGYLEDRNVVVTVNKE